MADWYIKRGEEVTGPIRTDKLQESVAAGKILPTDKLAKDAAGPWTTAGKTRLFAKGQTPELPSDEWMTMVSPERVAEATRKSSKSILWAVGAIALLAAASVAGMMILASRKPEPAVAESAIAEPTSVSGPGPKPIAANIPEPAKELPAPQQPKHFEYKILDEEWHDGFHGKSVSVEVQVADEVAPTVTQADLESLVPVFMEKYEGAPFQILFYTVTPLANAWGAINYTPNSRLGAIDCHINDFAFEMGPWYFPDKIDRNTDWHKRVWITLPMANKIVNGATQYHWEVTSRSANDVYFDSKERPFGALKDDMRLSPQTWEICTYDGDVPRFVRLVESSLNHLNYELSQNIVGKLNSVIGSQEYLSRDKSNWTWMLGKREVSYTHLDKNDMITIMQTDPQ